METRYLVNARAGRDVFTSVRVAGQRRWRWPWRDCRATQLQHKTTGVRWGESSDELSVRRGHDRVRARGGTAVLRGRPAGRTAGMIVPVHRTCPDACLTGCHIGRDQDAEAVGWMPAASSMAAAMPGADARHPRSTGFCPAASPSIFLSYPARGPPGRRLRRVGSPPAAECRLTLAAAGHRGPVIEPHRVLRTPPCERTRLHASHVSATGHLSIEEREHVSPWRTLYRSHAIGQRRTRRDPNS